MAAKSSVQTGAESAAIVFAKRCGRHSGGELPARCLHYFAEADYGYNSHEQGVCLMRSVNVAELKNQLSKYLTFAKGGEEVVIRDRNLPVAKLVPFSSEGADEQELKLVAAGKLRLPKMRLNVKRLSTIATGSVVGNKAIQAITADREEEL
jgi:prevent-host-death family protein